MATLYQATWTGVDLCGGDIATVRLTRPDGYGFRAGQWFRLTLDTPDGPLTETFSHASAPSDPGIELATRLTGTPFKRALAGLGAGDAVRIAGPGGRLRLPDDAPRLAFLVGGVGITPVRSLLRDARAHGRVFDDALLLYGNRDESCIPFGAELAAMSDLGVRLVNVLERPTGEWEGERGFIDAEIVRRYLGPDDGRPFVLTGPPVMVAAVEGVLDELSVAPERRIIERFGTAE